MTCNAMQVSRPERRLPVRGSYFSWFSGKARELGKQLFLRNVVGWTFVSVAFPRLDDRQEYPPLNCSHPLRKGHITMMFSKPMSVSTPSLISYSNESFPVNVEPGS